MNFQLCFFLPKLRVGYATPQAEKRLGKSKLFADGIICRGRRMEDPSSMMVCWCYMNGEEDARMHIQSCPSSNIKLPIIGAIMVG